MVPFKLVQGNQVLSLVEGDFRAFRHVAGTVGFLSRWYGYLGEPIELHKWNQASFRVLRGNSS